MKDFEISGEEFEFLAEAFYSYAIEFEFVERATAIKVMVEHLANISVTDVISSDSVGITPEGIKLRCDERNRALTATCMSACHAVSKMDDADVKLLVALAMGVNVQRSANFYGITLGVSWEEEAYLSESDNEIDLDDDDDDDDEDTRDAGNGKTYRGIVIDPFTKEIREAEIADGIQALYDAIGADCVCGGMPIPGHFMYVGDDEKSSMLDPFFAFEGYPLQGRAVILGLDKTGESAPCTLSVEAVISKTTWPSLAEVLRTA